MGGNILSLGLLKVFRCKSLWRPAVGNDGKMLLPRFLLIIFHLRQCWRKLKSLNSQIFQLSEHNERLFVNVIDVVSFQVSEDKFMIYDSLKTLSHKCFLLTAFAASSSQWMCHGGRFRFDCKELADRAAAQGSGMVDDEETWYDSMPNSAVEVLGSFSDLEHAPACWTSTPLLETEAETKADN